MRLDGDSPSTARGTDASVIVALGNPVARLALAKRVTDSGLSLLNAVHPTAAIASTASLGRGNFVGIGAVVCAGARVGDNCVLNNGSMLEHDSILADGVQLAPRSVVAARDTIDRGAFVCVGATILSRLRVGAYSVVGAGALVNRDVPAGVFVAGAPARMIERAGETFDWGRLL
jgi:sugar O-acyltransferase (sialic acid O-acetyltransferase NeuD family)